MEAEQYTSDADVLARHGRYRRC